jgi:hypothetical protein
MGQCSSIGVFDLAAKGYAMGNATDVFYVLANQSTNEVRRRLSFNGWVGC